MIINDGFVIRKIAHEWVAVPMGTRTSEFSGLISLSDSGKFLWELLHDDKTENELAAALINTYEIDEITARADVKDFMAYLKENKLVAE